MTRRSVAPLGRLLPVAVVLGLAATACGGSSTDTSAKPAATNGSSASSDAYLTDIKAQVQKYTSPSTTWDGPTTGPKAAAGKKIIYVSADQRNGGALGVAKGVQEAGKAIGWDVRVLDGQGTASGAASALDQAIALKPDGIVLGTVDAIQAKVQIQKAKAAGIVVVGWHSAPDPGPVANPEVFANITTKAEEVAKAAAQYVIAESGGKAGAIIFTDSAYTLAIKKSETIRDEIKKCPGCSVLEYVDTPIADTASRMQPLTSNLIQKYGEKWTYGLAVNDLYFDYAQAAVRAAGKGPQGPPQFVSAGDGSESAFQRIRKDEYQIGTVAEPLNLQGWECIDELNRAFNKVPWSNYVPAVHLVTKENLAFDGGPKNQYDPENGYRDEYKKVWGK